ncbi:helix-turn-helix transcriptional regulator [Alkalihalophilus pseudofirmus]|uniref:Helix-turn-helix transcriptional regulator n=1 Tax=Alkalihalophilus pseudofirmus TaxID=79885 RepID=A0AAJ2KSD9_ALKPS|nr:helix-turn-helix transcriptional regulator [Alkalihalophilus pseudofirmus]MDV2883794.1 helix-turn-helix transcriptional regulator [Alkalihalophilus pseudofirmus]
MNSFGDRLKAQREKKKRNNPQWTQQFVADKLDVARSTYTAYERGTKQPSLETLSKIADILETSTDYLLGREIKEPNTSNISYAAKDGASSRTRTKEEDEEMTEKFRQFLEWQRKVKNREE